MYCCHCGKELVEGSKYCIFCGKPCGERHDGEIQSECNSGSSQSGIPCPFCASQNTHPIVHTSTQAYSGGYSCLGGACGGILFGPIGLLLGLCGKSSTVQTSSQTKWVCKNCGAEFSNNEPVSIDGIVIQNIVFLKFSGVIDKIIIDSKIPYFDIGIGDHIF